MAEELNFAEITVEEFFNAVGDGSIKSKTKPTEAKTILNVLNKEKYNFNIKMPMQDFNHVDTIQELLDIFKEEKKIPVITEEIAKKLRGDKKENWKDIVGKRYIPKPNEMMRASARLVGKESNPIPPKKLKFQYDRIRQLIDTYNNKAKTSRVPIFGNAMQQFEREDVATKGSWGATGYDHPTRNIDYSLVDNRFLFSATDRVLSELPSDSFEDISIKNYFKLKENTGIRHSGASSELPNITFGQDVNNPIQGAYYNPESNTFENVGAKTGVQRTVPANDSATIAIKEQIANREEQLGRRLEIGEKLFDTKTVPESTMEERINKKLTEVMTTIENIDAQGNIQKGLKVKVFDKDKFKWVDKTEFTFKELRGDLSTSIQKIEEIAPTEEERKKVADFVLAHNKDEVKTVVLDTSYTKNTKFDTGNKELDNIRRALYLVDKYKSENVFAYDSEGKLILDADKNPQRKYVNLDTGESDYIKMLSAQSAYDQTTSPKFNIAQEFDKEDSLFRLHKEISPSVVPIENSIQEGADVRVAQQAEVKSPFQPDVEQLKKSKFVREHIVDTISSLQKDIPELKEWNTLDVSVKEKYIDWFQTRYGKDLETLGVVEDVIRLGADKNLLISGKNVNQGFNIHSIFLNGLAVNGHTEAKNARKKLLTRAGVTASQITELGLDPVQAVEGEDVQNFIKPSQIELREKFNEASRILKQTGMSYEDRFDAKQNGTILQLAADVKPDFAESIKNYDHESVSNFSVKKFGTKKAIAKGVGVLTAILPPQSKAIELMAELGIEATTPSTTGPRKAESIEEKLPQLMEMVKGKSVVGLETPEIITETVQNIEDQLKLEERQEQFRKKKLSQREKLGEQVGLMFKEYDKQPSKLLSMDKKDLEELKTKLKNVKQRPVDSTAKIRTQKILESQRLAEEKDKRELEEGVPSFLESQLDTDNNTMEDIQQYLKNRSNELRKSNTLQ